MRWYDDPKVAERLNSFRNDILHPHVFQEERATLSFMYYLDYCRAFPHTFRARPAIKKAPADEATPSADTIVETEVSEPIAVESNDGAVESV